jgi:hypothetical protein
MRAIYEMIKAYSLEYIETQPINFVLWSMLALVCVCFLLLITVVIFRGGKSCSRFHIKEAAEADEASFLVCNKM